MVNRSTILIFNQTYPPDPTSVGQHVADIAEELVRRGYRVRLFTACRAYNDPTRHYPHRQCVNGVEIVRFPLSALGKKSMLHRAIGAIGFLLQCCVITLLTRDFAAIVFTSSPPLLGLVPVLANLLRRVPVVYWALDLNIEQLLDLHLVEHPLITRMLRRAHHCISAHSTVVITLDHFMADRLQDDAHRIRKLTIIPPWSHDQHLGVVEHAHNPFRRTYDLDCKFVIMYSGNQTPHHPLDTLLKAAVLLRDDPHVVFVFIGDGLAHQQIEEHLCKHQLKNILSLPYQPLNQLRYSLSAADVHVVCMGDQMTGTLHPCKVYGIMAVARPVLYIGPQHSPIAELVEQHHIGWQIRHGDVDHAVRIIRSLASEDPQRLQELGQRNRTLLTTRLSQQRLCGQFCDEVEAVLTSHL